MRLYGQTRAIRTNRSVPASGHTGCLADDNLTRAEAEARAARLSVESYDIALDLTGEGDTFVSTTTVRFTANVPGGDTFVDLDAAGVREIVLNGMPLPGDVFDAEHSRLHLGGLESDNVLRVVADCTYQHTGVGLHRFDDPTDGNRYLHTQFEPYDAHRVFACFDQPDLKATFDVAVEAPEGWTVVSNSPVVAHEGGTWRFATTARISTYLAALVAGPYHAVHEEHRGIPLSIYCRESLAQYLDADEILTVTRQGLDFFESEFGYPYPFPTYDQLFVPEFNFGAMENPGCVTFNEGYVFRSRVTDAAYERRAGTILHEMAHMWFGDLVTMRWWDDLWLNESFATYMGNDAVARATRFTDAWVRFASGEKAWALVQDQLPTTHPISADIVDTDAVRLHFDGITYAKGASVLKQLVAWVGKEAFTEGVRRYFRRHEWSNASLADFLGALEETSGRKLEPWSEEWLQTSGVNTLRAVATVSCGRYDGFAVTQSGPPLRSHRLAIGLYDHDVEGGGGLVRRRTVELDVVGESTEVDDLLGEAEADLVLVNDDDLTYAKVRLDERSVATLEHHLSDIADPLARNLCWASTWDMVRDAELPTRRFVALVLAHASGETDDSTLTRLLGQAASAVDAFGDPAHRPAAMTALAAQARAGLDSAEAGSDRQLIWVRHLLSVAESADDLAFTSGLLDGTVVVPGLKVDTDLRWSIVGTLAAAGVEGVEAVIDAELGRDPTDIGHRRAASARASRPTEAAKAEAWAAATSPDLALAMMRAVTGGFWQWGQDAVLEPYVDRYFGSLRDWWDTRSREEALGLGNGFFPRTLVRGEVVAATDRCLTDADLAGPLRRILLEGKDGIERAVRARAADQSA
ncbi:MAG: aminopeptidase [Actinomycetota bacterium]|nr:aminopeptidase [Actinomycetota bacterium]